MKNNSIPPPSKEHTSDLIRQIFNDSDESNIEIGYVLKQFRRRSFGGILIILAAIALIPGISFFAGIVIIILGSQILAGFRAPIVPKFISKQTVQIDKFRSLVDKALPLIERIERLVKPRWLIFTQPPILFLVALLIIGLACVVMLPLPFSNLPPAIALLIVSIGLLERDGVIIFIGMLVASIALFIGVFILQFALESMHLFFEKHFR